MRIKLTADNINIEVSQDHNPEPLFAYSAEKYNFNVDVPGLIAAMQQLTAQCMKTGDDEPKHDFFKDMPLKGNGNDNARHTDFDKA